MDPELKKQLEEIHTFTKENNHMLRAIRRDQWLGFIGRVVVWIIVLILPFYLYQQYFEPIVSSFFSATSTPMGAGPFGFPSSEQVQHFIDAYKAK